MGTTLAGPAVVKVKSLSCPNCGGPVELRGFAHTLNVVCPQCMSVLDASTPEVQVLQTLQSQLHVQPKIPLGSRGKIHDTFYEVIGYQVREVYADGEVFSWDEYLLFNPYKGFRYLTEYHGHWNFVRTLSALPEGTRSGMKLAMRFQGVSYLGFDRMTAKTSYVLGEFPWQVRVGDSVECADFISPPYMLSSESTDGEITWSLAEYTDGKLLWQAFKLPGAPPTPYGVFANQPSPYKGTVGSVWRTWLWLNVALLALLLYFSVASAGREVFNQKYGFSPAKASDASFVTPTFNLSGRNSNVEISVKTDLVNNWVYFNFALINEETGQAFDFAREVSYYRDSDGNEGSPSNSVIVPGVPSGKYYLRVEPEMDRGAVPVNYEIVVRRDVPNNTFFLITAGLLLIPPIVKTVRRSSFEAQRWRESDYGPMVSKFGTGFAKAIGDDD
jgi:hypothetical protein